MAVALSLNEPSDTAPGAPVATLQTNTPMSTSLSARSHRVTTLEHQNARKGPQGRRSVEALVRGADIEIMRFEGWTKSWRLSHQ
jgi:hypothetical protein